MVIINDFEVFGYIEIIVKRPFHSIDRRPADCLDAPVRGQVLTCCLLFNCGLFILLRLLGISYRLQQYGLRIMPNIYLLN